MKTTIIIILALLFLTNFVFGQSKKDSLIVFVGEKIEVKYSPEKPKEPQIRTIIRGKDTTYAKTVSISMDNEYIAKYKILKLIHGSFKQDTINFTVYDHYGEPAFSKHQTVLLFVSYRDGKLYHEKYQYYDLYLSTDNKWASPYPTSDYNHSFKDNITVKPEKIRFKNKVTFAVGKLSTSEVQTWFPKPYYKIKNGKAKAIYGNYVEDLFKIKQQTILKARGIY